MLISTLGPHCAPQIQNGHHHLPYWILMLICPFKWHVCDTWNSTNVMLKYFDRLFLSNCYTVKPWSREQVPISGWKKNELRIIDWRQACKSFVHRGRVYMPYERIVLQSAVLEIVATTLTMPVRSGAIQTRLYLKIAMGLNHAVKTVTGEFGYMHFRIADLLHGYQLKKQ